MISLLLLALSWAGPMWAQAGRGKTSGSTALKVKPVMSTWHMPNDFGIADTLAIDTAEANFPMRDVLNDNSIAWAYNGNLISPLQSKIYFDRSGNGMLGSTGTSGDAWLKGGMAQLPRVRRKVDFLFAQPYEPYILTAQDVRFYRTTVAYSDIAYKKGFTTYHAENDLSFSFTGNINRKTNLGAKANYLNSPGHYTSQEGKAFAGYVFGSYDGDHYGLHAAVCFNKIANFENGGLEDPSLLGGSLKPEDLPTRMMGMTELKHISGYLDHHYSITREREVKETIRGRRGTPDRDTTYVVHVPVLTFNHTFETNTSVKRYVEQRANQGFFPSSYLNQSNTHDTVSVLNIRNTISVSLNEEFNRILRFGATAYVINEFQRYQFTIGQADTLIPAGFGADYDALLGLQMHQMPDTLVGSHWTNNTWVGGAIYKNQGRWIKYNVNGDVCLAGYKLGEFQVNGHVDGEFPIGKDSLYVRASAYIKNETPDWYLQHYKTNHYIWENDFSKMYRFYFGGEVSYPTTWVKPRARVGFENLTHMIYFEQAGTPKQHEGNIQVLSADLRLDITTPWVNLENSVVYQHSSDSVLPLPALTLYHNLYYHGWWAKKAMYAQIGVDLRYHTSYYAPVLNPATGQFCAQFDTKVGNYPIMNVYLNAYVKLLKLRLFVQWQNFNYYFMKERPNLSMPGYAMNPAVIRAGAAWHFWR